MINAVFTEYQSQPWIMEPGALKAFAEQLGSMPMNAALFGIEVAQKAAELTVTGGIARIPITGYLLNKVPGWLRAWGIEATGYDEIAAQIKIAVDRKDVTGIELVVDSPGGMVAGVIGAADAIYNARQSKPVNAIVNNLSASGAYWLTSQANEIKAADANTLAGSIGVYTWYVDFSKARESKGIKVIVIRSGEHKGKGLDEITENQIAAVQEYIDATAENFINAVARGRGKEAGSIRELATGQLWIAAKARELGLIDSVTVQTNQTSQSDIKGEIVMKTEEEIKAEQAEQIAKVTAKATAEGKETAISEERQRISAINEKFGEDPEFAFKAVAEGWTMAEAHEAYNDVLRKKLKMQNAEHSTQNQQAEGSAAIATGDTDEGTGGDFMTEAREMAAEKKITVTAAMRKLTRTKPALHQAFLGKCKTTGKAMYAEAG